MLPPCACRIMKKFVCHNKKVAPNIFLSFNDCTIWLQLDTSLTWKGELYVYLLFGK